jgi:hypothetical protein
VGDCRDEYVVLTDAIQERVRKAIEHETMFSPASFGISVRRLEDPADGVIDFECERLRDRGDQTADSRQQTIDVRRPLVLRPAVLVDADR